MQLMHICEGMLGLLNPITEKFSDRATLESPNQAHKPADSDVPVGNGARC